MFFTGEENLQYIFDKLTEVDTIINTLGYELKLAAVMDDINNCFRERDNALALAQAKNIKDEKAKQSFLRGFLSGRKGRSTGAINKTLDNKRKFKNKVSPGAYNSRGRINENLVDDRHGPVVFFAGNDFDYDSKGRIKGSYTVDGKFEPD